jgi:hypothetical protein
LEEVGELLNEELYRPEVGSSVAKVGGFAIAQLVVEDDSPSAAG